jgi:acetyl/propionyl-CoA carboxylase alpha subunit
MIGEEAVLKPPNHTRPINTVLVANRGEIARRLFRACRKLGLQSVAVYSDPDAGSVWSRQADLSVRLPGTSATSTYLDIDAILGAARQVGADAIHPGYGFLSENPHFAAACAQAGLTFIGPRPEVIALMAAKTTGRAAAVAAGVPVVPGEDGGGRSDEELAAAAVRTGYPIMIKANAGGGGRGMRVVEDPADLRDVLPAARAEARSAFGSGELLIERYFPRVRHVEVQVLADEHGSLVHLFERDCSIQRRHQKLIEESPAPGLSDDLRNEITASALALARQVEYTSAGTVEFLVDEDERYYFIEMNTRLQVEHAVTEAVTGVDLAAWQIRIAAGEALDFNQASLLQQRHAIECRIYAEDPARDCLPSTGTIAIYRPAGGPGLRCDDGIAAGSVISPHYDSLLAKVIATGWDRQDALQLMDQALAQTLVLGVVTNIPYLQDIVAHPAFRSGAVSTRFLADYMAGWPQTTALSEEQWLALAAFECLTASDTRDEAAIPLIGLVMDPWAAAGAWRNVP